MEKGKKGGEEIEDILLNNKNKTKEGHYIQVYRIR